MSKDSFVLYDSYKDVFSALTNEQAGMLIKAIFAYRAGTAAPSLDAVTGMAFLFIRSRLDVDTKRYEEVCEKRRKSGKAGAASRYGKSPECVADAPVSDVIARRVEEFDREFGSKW